MNNTEYSVLVIGNISSIYINQFVKHLKENNPSAKIYFWGYSREECETDKSFLNCLENYCLFDIRSIMKSSAFWQLKAISEMRKSFRNYASGKNFDYVNIHYIKPEYFFLIKLFKKCSQSLVITPWGSDVYRVKGLNRLLVKKILDMADYITGSDDRFTKELIVMYNVPTSKIVHCDLGVAPIDYIICNKNLIDENEAKRQLAIENKYVITCGYNASSAHRHLEIIEAVNKVRNQLPNNLLLLFPLTYHKAPEYVDSIKQKVDEYGFEAIYFEDFLDIPSLFLLRQATDLFIHIQPTDGSSGTLAEYILCEKKILNGAWLKYPEIEKNGHMPYFLVDNLENLDQAIVNAFQSEPITIDKSVLQYLEKRQWKVMIKDWDSFFSNNFD